MSTPPARVLILCTGNSARSQMAEGLLRHLGAGRYEVFSAGTEPSVVNPLAIQVMAEQGIDISDHRSKHLNEFLGQPFDYVITVCDRANESCPIFPGNVQRIHWGFDDPAAATGTEAERLVAFRRIAAQISERLQAWVTHQRQ
jgi:arsenate reductase